MNLGRRLGDVATRSATRPALVGETGTLTYAELEHRIGTAAARTCAHDGVGAGDRVALLLPNGPAVVAAFLAMRFVSARSPFR